MKKSRRYWSLIPINLVVLAAFLLSAIGGSKAITVFSETAPISPRTCVIIDAGHGGVDGGATSCTGVLESQINLEIALILNDLMNLLGIQTKMIRNTDCSVYTEGNTIAAKKISDLKERVRIVNETENAVLISIHQNYFSESKYHGAQVFYANTMGSKAFAQQLQQTLINTVNPSSNRSCKKAEGIYLMQKVNCKAILIECGFLSNPAEEYLLRDHNYQQKLCCVIASATSQYLWSNTA